MRYPDKFKGKKIISFYSYQDAEKREVFIIGRTADKEFPIYHVGPNRHWVNKAPAFNYPYKLPEVLATSMHEPVIIVEGEKDVDTLTRLGFNATTNRSGANASNAFKLWTAYFKGRFIVIIPDNDKPGIRHAETVRAILAPVASMCLIVHLPGSGAKGDVTDWLTSGLGDAELLMKIIHKARNEAEDAASKATAVKASSYAPGDSWEAPEDRANNNLSWDEGWQPFPLDQLPIELADYAKESARMLSCDPGYIVPAELACMGSAIGNSRVIYLNDEWWEPCVFWTTLIAEASTLKSAAHNKGIWPVKELHAEFIKENSTELANWELAMEEHRFAEKRASKHNDNGACDPAPREPTPKRHLVDDITVEKLAEMLEQNPKGLILAMDELASWFSSFTRYKGTSGGGSDRPFWLKVFRAEGHDVDRKGGNKRAIHVLRCAVNATGTIQPETVSGLLSSDFFSSGFVARILFCMPPKAKKVFIKGGIDLQVKSYYRSVFQGLYFLDGESTFQRDYGHKPVQLTRKGLDAWETFHATWAEKQHAASGEISYALAKLEAYCARFALMFALIDYVCKRIPCEEVDATHIERGHAVVEWFANETHRVYAMIRKPVVQLERERLIAFIRGKDEGITANKLFLSNPSRYKDSEGAKKKLEELVEDGVLRKELHPTASGTGFDKTIYFGL